MKVILKENVEGLGYLGDLLTVADGYARNFLLPRGKAVIANTRSLKSLEHLKRVAAQQAKKELQGVEEFGQAMGKVSLTFPVQTGKDDKLFGSVTSKDIADGMAKQGIEVDRRKIQLPQPLKELGTFTIPIKLHREVVPEISVTLVKQGAEEVAVKEEERTEGAVAEEETTNPETSEVVEAGEEEEHV